MTTLDHTVHTHLYMLNMEKTTPFVPAQNRKIFQQNADSVKGPTRPTTKDTQYIRKSPRNTTLQTRKLNNHLH
jgi:hypothetical protein